MCRQLRSDSPCAPEVELHQVRLHRAGRGAQPSDRARHGGAGIVGPCVGVEVLRSLAALSAIGDLCACGPMFAMTVLRAIRPRPQCGLPTRRSAKGNIPSVIWKSSVARCRRTPTPASISSTKMAASNTRRAGRTCGAPSTIWSKRTVHQWRERRCSALTRYIEDGHIEIDNNPAERSLRGVALGRKNYLFSGYRRRTCRDDLRPGRFSETQRTRSRSLSARGADPHRRSPDQPNRGVVPWNLAARVSPANQNVG